MDDSRSRENVPLKLTKSDVGMLAQGAHNQSRAQSMGYCCTDICPCAGITATAILYGNRNQGKYVFSVWFASAVSTSRSQVEGRVPIAKMTGWSVSLIGRA